MTGSVGYAILSCVAFACSTVIASRLFGRHAEGEAGSRLALVWIAALVGAIIGAKLAFLLAEGWAKRNDMTALIGGRSVAGALLGGYAAVEIAKWRLGIVRATGDVFAITVPLSLAIGRVGCVLAGCCQGVECDPSWWTVRDAAGHARWPAAECELAFNVAFLAWAVLAARFGWQRDQRFHVYLMAYGLFRFAHEFMREDPRWIGSIGGYHVVAGGLVVLGAVGYARRAATNRREVSVTLTERVGRSPGPLKE
ncbi:MAG: prolipoprotein diacylglyceryl transferase family protein [Phycisphaerales bacterium]